MTIEEGNEHERKRRLLEQSLEWVHDMVWDEPNGEVIKLLAAEVQRLRKDNAYSKLVQLHAKVIQLESEKEGLQRVFDRVTGYNKSLAEDNEKAERTIREQDEEIQDLRTQVQDHQELLDRAISAGKKHQTENESLRSVVEMGDKAHLEQMVELGKRRLLMDWYEQLEAVARHDAPFSQSIRGWLQHNAKPGDVP